MYYQSTVSTLDITLICDTTDRTSAVNAREAVEQLRNFNSSIDKNRQGNWITRSSTLATNHVKYRVICGEDQIDEFPPKTPVKITKNNIRVDFTNNEKVKISSYCLENEDTDESDIIAYSSNVCVPITASGKIAYVNYTNARDRLFMCEHIGSFLEKHQNKGRSIG